MKIIGESDMGFIISADRDEIANLTGYYSQYNYDKEQQLPKVGDEIRVHEMYRRLYVLAQRRGEIKTAQKMLRDAANELELVDPLIGQTEPEKAKE